MSKRGVFITFEGPEGSGKSTHSRRLTHWLRARGYSVLFTREPGGTALGRKLRKILLDRRSKGIDPLVELCLYEASRSLLVREVIHPALEAGRIVVVDRFQDSTWVYQGWAGKLKLDLVESIGQAATGGLKPDLTILLDLPASVGLARVRRPNRFEAKPLAFHRKVRQGYRVSARRHPDRFRVIRADEPVNQVQGKIREALKDVLGKRSRA